MTYRLVKLVVREAWSRSMCKDCTKCAEMCRGMLCWVQCKAVLGAVQSCAGCDAKLCWVQSKAVLTDLQELTSC